MTIGEYIEMRKNEIKSGISGNILARECKVKGHNDKASLNARKAEFKETEKFKSMLDTSLAKHKKYLKYAAPDAIDNAAIIEEYNEYVRKEKERMIEEERAHTAEEMQKLGMERATDFLEYVESKEDDINAYMKHRVQKQIKKLNERLRTSGNIKIRDYIHDDFSDDLDYIYKSKLDPKTFDADQCKDLVLEWQERFCDSKDFFDLVMLALEKYDADGFAEACTAMYRDVSEENRQDVLAGVMRAFNTKKMQGAFLADADHIFKYGIVEGVKYEHVIKQLELNPVYGPAIIAREEEIKKEKEKQERIETDIRKRIPENPIDLFPQARAMHRKFVLHVGETNSGKTHDALEALAAAKSGVYLGPLRLLAFEAYETLNDMGVPCSLITGEEEFRVDGALHTAATVEILDTETHWDVAVIDEAQMIADSERGWAWTSAILGVAADTVHICCAPEAQKILIALIEACGDEYEIVEHQRQVPLIKDTYKFKFPDDVQDNDALIVFSKRSVLMCAGELQRHGISCSVIYGSLPYEVRQNEVRRFLNGETKVIVATDAIGMGMNLPIKRIVFLENEKFDGNERRPLKSSEIRQIAGRAGRQGIYDEGHYLFAFDSNTMSRIMKTNTPDIETASLGFPEYLLSIDEPLSDVMLRWMQMESNGIFSRANLDVQYKLCRELERQTDNKKLIYDFITIPFNPDDDEQKDLWLYLFRTEKSGVHAEFNAPDYNRNNLDSMEEAYKICDLMYAYLRKFSSKDKLDEVMAYKSRITKDLMKHLKSKKFPVRTCSVCGKPMPWNYRYGLCEDCYANRYRHYYDWYDYDIEEDLY